MVRKQYPNIRIFLREQLKVAGVELVLTAPQNHYLLNVMRLKVGDCCFVFNGKDGEWIARLVRRKTGGVALRMEACVREQPPEVGPTVLFALLKRGPTETIVEKSTELGASQLEPLITHKTTSRSTNLQRLQSIAIEASEQCTRLTVPPILPLCGLSSRLDSWPENRPLLFLDTSENGVSFRQYFECRIQPVALSTLPPPGILVGPEGGMSKSETDALSRLPFVTSISLGPLTLRAETAAISALALWQSTAGSWVKKLDKGNS